MLTKQQLSSFNDNGFVVISNVLNDCDLQPLETEYAYLLDRYCNELYEAGRITDLFKSDVFSERFTKVLAQCPEYIDRFNISLPLDNGNIDASIYIAHTGPAVFDLLINEKILDAVESIIGAEIASSPVQQMRLKPPQQKLNSNNIDHSGIGTTTWHQDTVAVLPEAKNTNQVTVWVAVTDASERNGCLVSIPGSHKKGDLEHTPGLIPREPSISAKLINGRKGQPLPVKRGGIIIFHKQNIHCALPNQSDEFRWSMDIRYHPVGQPSGRPAFPGFVARSRSNPESELRDAIKWNALWQKSRLNIIQGNYKGPIFKDWQ